VWCDNTSECLGIQLRPGNAGANTAADHITVLAAAIRQVPAVHRRRLLVRADGAGASHSLLDWLVANNQIRGRQVEFSVGFAATEAVPAAIRRLPARAWSPAIDADGQFRDGGLSRKLTGLNRCRNTGLFEQQELLVERLRWGLPAEGLAGPGIQRTGDCPPSPTRTAT